MENMINIGLTHTNEGAKTFFNRTGVFWNEVLDIVDTVVEDLSIERDIVFIMSNTMEDHSLGGHIYDEKLNAHLVFINIYTLYAIGSIDRAKVTIAHELRHAWQTEQDWVFNYDIPYEERFHERDARIYSEAIVNKTLREHGLDTDGDAIADLLYSI